jgi:hypothetical protein
MPPVMFHNRGSECDDRPQRQAINTSGGRRHRQVTDPR